MRRVEASINDQNEHPVVTILACLKSVIVFLQKSSFQAPSVSWCISALQTYDVNKGKKRSYEVYIINNHISSEMLVALPNKALIGLTFERNGSYPLHYYGYQSTCGAKKNVRFVHINNLE